MKLYNLSFEIWILYRSFQTFLISTHTKKSSFPYDLVHADTIEVHFTKQYLQHWLFFFSSDTDLTPSKLISHFPGGLPGEQHCSRKPLP